MGKTRNLIVSGIAGFLFAVGWWLFIDASAYRDYSYDNAGPFVYYIGGILGTIGLFLFNNLSEELFKSGGWGDETAWWEKALIVFSVMLHLASIIASIWIYFARKGDHSIKAANWQGIAGIIQTILITASSCVWRFGLKTDDGW